MTHKILILLIVGMAGAAFMSYGCGGGDKAAGGVEPLALDETYHAFVSGTVGGPGSGPKVYRDTFAEGDAGGDSQGDNIYEAVVLECAFGAPSVEGGAVVDVSPDDASSCTTPNNCLIYIVTTGGVSPNPLCTIEIDATFSVGLPNIASSHIEIPLTTTITMESSMESTDGEAILGFSSFDWDDAFDFTDVQVDVDLTACAAGTGILELVPDILPLTPWPENIDDSATTFVRGYEFASTDPQVDGDDYYAQCVATAALVGKVSLADIATTPVESIGEINYAALLCDDNDNNDCFLADYWSYYPVP